VITLRKAAAILLLALVPVAAASAAQQQSITSADIERLQDGVAEVNADLATLRERDADRAAAIEREVEILREDVVYLRATLRRQGEVSRSEFDQTEKELAALRQKVRQALGGVVSTQPEAGPREIPVGTELDVRLQSGLSSRTAQVEDRFEATTVLNVEKGDRILVPAGSVVRGIVSAVDRAGRLDRVGRLTLNFDQITIRGRSEPIRATVTKALESEGLEGEAARIGTGAGIGAIVGGILGGFKGVLTGILIGGGGVIAATEGEDVTLPAGTILRIRLDTPLVVP
jgi:hypothetical protein